jgi:hypothetical protein
VQGYNAFDTGVRIVRAELTEDGCISVIFLAWVDAEQGAERRGSLKEAGENA